ncbi:MAG: hypothetical protein DRP79_07190 [Planctomycetota bacterium]|nr:MAG: hypothetical protein DRP79_07190 [Planctomycetota bacterium]
MILRTTLSTILLAAVLAVPADLTNSRAYCDDTPGAEKAEPHPEKGERLNGEEIRPEMSEQQISALVAENVDLLKSRFEADRERAARALVALAALDKRVEKYLAKEISAAGDDRAQKIMLDIMTISGAKWYIPHLIDMALDPATTGTVRRAALLGLEVLDPWGEKRAGLAADKTAEKIKKVNRLMAGEANLEDDKFDLEYLLLKSADFHNSARFRAFEDAPDIKELLEKIKSAENAGKTGEALELCQQILDRGDFRMVLREGTERVAIPSDAMAMPVVGRLIRTNIEKYREMYDDDAERLLERLTEEMDSDGLHNFLTRFGLTSRGAQAARMLMDLQFEARAWPDLTWSWERYGHLIPKPGPILLCRVGLAYASLAQRDRAMVIHANLKVRHPDAAILVGGKEVNAQEYLGEFIRKAPRDLTGTLASGKETTYGSPSITKDRAARYNLEEPIWARSIRYYSGNVRYIRFKDKNGREHLLPPWEAPSNKERIEAFAAAKGWKYLGRRSYVANLPRPYFNCPFYPAIHADRMVIGNGLKVFCFSVSTGRLLWVYDNYSSDIDFNRQHIRIGRPVKFPFVMIIPETNSVIALIEHGDIIARAAGGDAEALNAVRTDGKLNGRAGHGVVCLDLDTGARKWTTEHGGEFLEKLNFYSLPAYDDDTLYFAVQTPMSKLKAAARELYLLALDAKTGAFKWVTLLGGWGNPSMIRRLSRQFFPSSPILLGDIIIVQTNAGLMASCNASDGGIRWVAKYDQCYMRAPSVSDPGTMGMYGKYGRSSTRMNNIPAVWGNNIYALPDDCDFLYAFDLASGRLLWRVRHVYRPTGLRSNDDWQAMRMRQMFINPEGTIFLVGDGVMSVSPRGGINWINRDERLVAEGRAVMFEDDIVLPVRDGLALVDSKTGRYLRTCAPDLKASLEKRVAELIPLFLRGNEKEAAAAKEELERYGSIAVEALKARAGTSEGEEKGALLELAGWIEMREKFAKDLSGRRDSHAKTLSAAGGKLFLVTQEGEILAFGKK